VREDLCAKSLDFRFTIGITHRPPQRAEGMGDVPRTGAATFERDRNMRFGSAYWRRGLVPYRLGNIVVTGSNQKSGGDAADHEWAGE
jgi:hypothetical protein